MAESRFAVEFHDLEKSFGEKQALDRLSLRIPRRGIHAIVGRNGAGKSTLLRIMLGLMTPSGGTALVFGINSLNLTHRERARIGFVNDEHSLPSWLPVNGLSKMHRVAYSQWDESVFSEVLASFEVQPRQMVGQLSRGERAGLSLALAMAQSPELLILDEPTTGLDVVAKQTFLETLLLARRQLNRTILYCSHQMDEVERVADQLILLERGQRKWSGAPDDFCDRVRYWTVEFGDVRSQVDKVPGLLNARRIEGRWHLLLMDQNVAHVAACLRDLGGTNICHTPIGLDKAINAFLAGRRDGSG